MANAYVENRHSGAGLETASSGMVGKFVPDSEVCGTSLGVQA
jgi:hypothetical protein